MLLLKNPLENNKHTTRWAYYQKKNFYLHRLDNFWVGYMFVQRNRKRLKQNENPENWVIIFNIILFRYTLAYIYFRLFHFIVVYWSLHSCTLFTPIPFAFRLRFLFLMLLLRLRLWFRLQSVNSVLPMHIISDGIKFTSNVIIATPTCSKLTVIVALNYFTPCSNNFIACIIDGETTSGIIGM